MGLTENCGFDLHSKWKHGHRNLITDVPGVKVGNVTINDYDASTHSSKWTNINKTYN